MAAVVNEVVALAKSFEDAVFNNEDVRTCEISGVKYAEVVGAIEFIAGTTIEHAQTTWRKMKDSYAQECKTYFFGFEPGMERALVANIDTLIKIAFNLKGSWASAFQETSIKVLLEKQNPTPEFIAALQARIEEQKARTPEPEPATT